MAEAKHIRPEDQADGQPGSGEAADRTGGGAARADAAPTPAPESGMGGTSDAGTAGDEAAAAAAFRRGGRGDRTRRPGNGAAGESH